MGGSSLIAFWIQFPGQAPLQGFGVTAHSIPDALDILAKAGYRVPEDETTLRIKTGIRVSDLDERHVRPNMGPIVVRGLWYPFTVVGCGS